MSLNAKNIKSESKFERPPALDTGTYPARIVQILDLGLQPQKPYQGEDKPPKYELMLTYECTDEFMLDEDGNEIEDKPRWLHETFPMNSLDSDLAKSTKRYVSLDPDNKFDGEWSLMSGVPCMINVVRNPSKKKGDDTVYNNISGVASMRKKDADKLPDLVNKPKVFDIDEPDMEVFGSLAKWIQDKMKDNLEFGGSALEEALENWTPPVDKDKEEKPKAKENKKSPEPSTDEADW